MNKTKKEQQNALAVGIAGVTILLILLMVISLFSIDISSDTNRESQVGAVSQVGTEGYVAQLESLAVSKGYTKGDKFTYNEHQQLETEEGRYKEFMKYLEGVEISESEFQEIKGIESNYQQSVQQVNESGKKDYVTLPNFLIVLVFIVFSVYMMLLITYALS